MISTFGGMDHHRGQNVHDGAPPSDANGSSRELFA